jgi:hypothetical protein
MNHQQVTAILNAAGYESEITTRAKRRHGYKVMELSYATVGVLCGTRYEPALVRQSLELAGLKIEARDNTACDALFVVA